MVSVCLPSDALLQHLPSYLGFSYLGRGVSLQGCSSKVQPLLLTLDGGYLLTTTLPDLQRGIAPLGPPAPVQPRLPGRVNSQKELPHVQGQGEQQRGDTQRPRSGAATRGVTPRLKSGAAAGRRYPMPQARRPGAAGGRSYPTSKDPWLHRRRKA